MKYTFDWKEYAAIAREAVAEGCVLLRNEDCALPVRPGERVSLFGRIQFDYYKSGTGSGGMVNAPYVVSILDGLRNCKEITLNEELLDVYEKWVEENPFDRGSGWACEPWSQKEMALTEELVKKAAAASDLAVVVLGRSAGEDNDNFAGAGSYLLTEEEENMLSLVCAGFARTAVVLNVGNVIDMKWVEKYRPQAVLYAWQGGMEGGNGVADVLTGKVSPSGKLSDTIAYDISDYPSTENFGGKIRNYYSEDIYVGYRYFETAAKDKVMYPFGFGLSYTAFESHVTAFDVTDKTVSVGVSVKNTGKMAGKEVVQIYYCPPQGALAKPVRNLIRFGKTKLLAPSESEDLEFTFAMNEMASYDDGGYTGNKSCYVLEPGVYTVYAGNSVRDAVPAGTFSIGELLVTEELSQACAPTEAFERLRIETAGGSAEIKREQVPLNTIDLSARILKNRPGSEACTGDKGYRLDDVRLGRVTMEEFLAQLEEEDLICLTRGEGMCSPKATPGIAAAFGGVTESLKRFGIPVAGCSDGPSGIRMDCGTSAFSLPNGTLLACSYNTDMVRRLYEMEGMELRKNKIDTLLGPGLNIHRNPLNGRNFEYFSEDPFLTGAMACAELAGMHKYGVTGTIKHFACNNQESCRHTADSVVSERALREIYLRAYEMCVKEGGAYCIMSTYGPLNGLWTAGNYDLLTTILRGEWGYQGLVMTDWWAKINEAGEDGFRENTTPMVRAQNDIYMVNGDALTNSNHDNTADGLAAGKITRGELLRNAANICRVIMRSPVMEFFGGSEDECTQINIPETEKSGAVQMPSAVLEEESELDVSRLKTDAGSNMQYAVKIPQRGRYRMEFKLKTDLGELAQVTMSISLNNTFLRAVTVSGTGGEWITEAVEFEVFAAIDNYISLYFAQSGITIGGICITRTALLKDF